MVQPFKGSSLSGPVPLNTQQSRHCQSDRLRRLPGWRFVVHRLEVFAWPKENVPKSPLVFPLSRPTWV